MLLCLNIYAQGFCITYTVTGRITDNSGSSMKGVSISMVAGQKEYKTVSGSDGSYSLKVHGIYGTISGSLECGNPHPNPFANSVNIPFIINQSGDIYFAVYSYTGKKIRQILFRSVDSGSYRIIWDGKSDNGNPVPQGLYIFAITFHGQTWSGRLIKNSGGTAFSSSTILEPVMMPPVNYSPQGSFKIPVITDVSCSGYYPVRITDIKLNRDTVIDFVLERRQDLPFKTGPDHIEIFTPAGYRPLVLKGVNLGSSPPGTFPGEIAYAISKEMYERWIERIAEAGFNSIRIYTLHPPVFYEKLANYNNRHTDNPILLFQGIWLDEIEDGNNPLDYDLTIRTKTFKEEIKEVIDCIHGNKDIAFRFGKSYGIYSTDVSRWTAGYIIGREILPQEIDTTNTRHPSMSSYPGSQFSISGATASETFITRMLDETVSYEYQTYSVRRPVSISSWPTLDPLDHPTETIPDEDKMSFDIMKINGRNQGAGLFATYHAYPYYPNFISNTPSYRLFSDSDGNNSYLGYLSGLREHYQGTPLLIGEFGVPSSWGSAHQSFSTMDHGGHSEKQQGEMNIRMMNNILNAGCAGGFMFSWMDEWFKPTWIVLYLEAYGTDSGGSIIPTRQLWHNITSPEQNFGLLAFDQLHILPPVPYQTDDASGNIKRIEATNDNSYFFLYIEADQPLSIGDTIQVAFDTYSTDTGESQLPNGRTLINRSEFLFSVVLGNDTAKYYVTEAYDMYGLSPRFNFTDPSVQKLKSTVSDGAGWNIMRWLNDGYEMTSFDIGRLPVENSSEFTRGQRSSAAWSGKDIRIRIPWTMLYFYDPTQMKIINGGITNDGGKSYVIVPAKSDGIAVSVYYKGAITSSTSRYNWQPWLIVPPTEPREKESLHVVETGLSSLPFFAD